MLIGTVSTVNAEANQNSIITDNGNVYFAGSMNNWKKVELEPDSANNKYTGSIVINGSDNYQFKIVVGSNWYSFNGVTFSKDNTVCENLYKDNDNFNLTPISKSDKINLNVVFYKNYNNSCSRLEVTQTLATDPVADSVTLEANPTSISGGESSTLTATLKGKNSSVGNVTYTFTDASNKTVGRKTTSDSTASIKVKPTATTTYKVTVSADNYTSVTNTVTVTATSDSSAETTQPVTGDYYFWYSTNPDIEHYSGNWHKVHMTKNGSSYYVSNLPVNVGGNFYFIVNENAEKPYRNTVWKTRNDVTVDYKECAGNLSDKGIEDRYVPMESNPNQKEQVFFYRISVIKNGSYSFTFDGDKTVKVTEGGSIQPTEPTETVKITVPTVDNATVTAVANSKIHNEGESFNIKEGSSFTVNVKGENGYTLKKITYGTQSGTETGAEFTAEPGVKTFSVDMVQTVSNPVTVTFGSDNNGTVSAIHNGAAFTSGTKVNVGDTVTFTAEPSKGYTFTSWTVNGAPASSTTNPYKITVDKDTTVVANFKEVTGTLSKYYLLCGVDQTFQTGKYTSVPLYINEKGEYYADFNAADITKDTDYFIIFSTKEDNSGIIVESNSVKVNSVSGNGFSLYNNNGGVHVGGPETKSATFAKVYINSYSDVTGFTIKITNLNLDNKTITYSAEPKFKETPKNAVNIFAKNGTIATNGTQDYGVTKVTSGVIDPTGSEKAGYTKYMAVKGSIITVQTTVNEDYKKEGYYVYAYCVNGKTVPAQKTEPGVYSASYTIDGTNTDIEITPVYFNTNIEEAGDYITFYVNADELEGKWGDTVALYTYYYKSDTVDNNNAYSATAYPGQPMLQNKDGLFYIKVPKYYYDKGQKQYGYNDDAKKPYAVSGMTINNYGLEGLHKTLKGAKDAEGNVANRQSYDYKDFAVLAEQGYDTIMFDVKYRKGTSNQSSLLKDEKDAPVMTDPKIDILTYGNKTHNGWDDFINYFSDKKTDVLGYDLDPKQAKKLYVVSTGNQKTTVGVWSTEWYVFDQYGNFIVQGNPNDFILTDKDVAEGSTNKIWNALKDYKGAVTKICYESEMNAKTSHEEGNDGIRVDGRWYYTKADDVKVTLKTSVEFSRDHGTTFFKDENTNPENTGFIGKETGVKAAINDVTSCEFTLNATDAVLTASSSSLWLFKGWYAIDADGNYIEYDKYAMSEIELVTGAYTEFVARYIEIGSGQLVLSHTAYDGPDKLGGRGTYYIQVDLTDKDGNTTTYDYTTGSITIPIAQSDQPISIKLKTVCAGNNTFFTGSMKRIKMASICRLVVKVIVM